MTDIHYPDIVIASRERASKLLVTEGPTFKHILSIGSPGESYPAGYHQQTKANKLRLEFDDVDPGDKFFASYMDVEDRAASHDQIKQLVRWCNRAATGGGRTLIHCMAGISRSSASACVLTAIKLGEGFELEAVQFVQNSKPDIWPNGHVLRLADSALARGGALVAAYDKVFEGYTPGKLAGILASSA